MELVPSSSAVLRVPLPLRLPDVYDPLQILLKATCSQEFRLLILQSTIGSVFSEKDLPRHVASRYHRLKPVGHESQFHPTTLVQL